MGDPKKLRKKYSGPAHPWQRARMEVESKILKAYGLKNKREIWKLNSLLRNFKHQAKKLSASQTAQANKESESLVKRLRKYGLLKENSQLGDVLSLTLPEVMDRRLQTVMYKKNLARSMKQARQFIVHHHITVAGKKITSPSYLVALEEEPQIAFAVHSHLQDDGHPERTPIEKKVKAVREKKPVRRKQRGR